MLWLLEAQSNCYGCEGVGWRAKSAHCCRRRPGPHWNSLRLGPKVDSNGLDKLGTVVDVKSWASEGHESDCVAVIWDVLGKIQNKRFIDGGF